MSEEHPLMYARRLMSTAQKQWWVILLAVFTIMALYGIWGVDYLGFQDHPSHLLSAYILHNYHNPAYNYETYFIPNLGLTPNQSSDVVILFFSRFFSPDVASKIFFSLYIILLPLSIFYFLKSVRPENLAYTLLASAYTFNHFVLMGNENFICSIPAFFFFLGHWYKNRDNHSVKPLLINTVLATFLYYCHIFSFACALGAVLIVSIAERDNMYKFLKNGLSFLPGMLLFIAWEMKMMIGKTANYIIQFSSVEQKALSLLDGFIPACLYAFERWGFLFLGSAMVILGVFLGGQKQQKKTWEWVILVFLVLAYAFPRWFILYDPGQRIILLALLLAVVIFPQKHIIKYIFLSCLIITTIILRMNEIKYLKETSKDVAYAIAPFKDVAQDAKYRNKKVLPLVLPSYAAFYHLHRVFEYYNIINGGVNPFSISGPGFSVRYRTILPSPDIYTPFPECLPKDMLELYDIIVILGRDGYRSRELFVHLASAGFRETKGNGFTAIFSKQ